MNFQYNFRQAHWDRLEAAGIIQYRTDDGFHGLRWGRLLNLRLYTRPLLRLAAAVASIFTQ
jgi:hypothetical protein